MTNDYIRLLKYLKPYTGYLIISLGLSVFYAAANVFYMPLMRDMLEIIGNQEFDQINLQIFYAVALFGVRTITQQSQTVLMSYVSQHLVLRFKMLVYDKFLRSSMDFHGSMKLGEKLNRMFGDTGAVLPALIRTFEKSTPQALTLIGTVIYLFSQDWLLALAAMVGLPIFMLLTMTLGQKLKKLTVKLQVKHGDFNHLAQEALSNIKAVKAFVRESFESTRFKTENLLALGMSMKMVSYRAVLDTFIALVQFVVVASVIRFGIYRISTGVMEAPELVQFVTGLVLMAEPIRSLSRVFNLTQQSLVSARRMFEIIDQDERVFEVDAPKATPALTKGIHFENVSYAYHGHDERVLNDVSLEVKAGEVVALVGMSGAGKSTLVSLIPRFYDPIDGAIKVDGRDIRDLALSDWRNIIGIVPQETVLFRGSIAENIRYGRLDATDEEVKDAAIQANAWEFIDKLPEKLEAKVGDQGHRLSGGQKQRLSIARAILRNPKVLILDEATSALDSESEKLVQSALTKLMVGRTTFVIAHRLSTITHADKIVVMDNGAIKEVGRHDQLMDHNGLYANYYNIQFNQAEIPA